MSYLVNTTERLVINNEEKRASDILDALSNYIQQFNKMLSLESMYIRKLSLTLDGENVTIKDEDASEYGNTYYVSKETAWGQKQVEHTQWQADHPLMQALNRIQSAKQIEYSADFSVMKLMGADYGTVFWKTYLEEHEEAKDYTSYKATEYYDEDDSVILVSFGKDGFVPVEFTAGASDVADVQEWFDFNFIARMEEVEDFKGTLVYWDELLEYIRQMNEKYNLDEEPDEPQYGEFIFDHLRRIRPEQVEELCHDLTWLKEFCEKHGGEFDYHATFIPSETDPENGYAVELREVEGEIRPFYCRF